MAWGIFRMSFDIRIIFPVSLANVDHQMPIEIPISAVANARRVQEALRVLEELAKIPDKIPDLDPDKFKQARFNLYTIERILLSKLLRKDKIKKLHGLYIIIDT